MNFWESLLEAFSGSSRNTNSIEQTRMLNIIKQIQTENKILMKKRKSQQVLFLMLQIRLVQFFQDAKVHILQPLRNTEVVRKNTMVSLKEKQIRFTTI